MQSRLVRVASSLALAAALAACTGVTAPSGTPRAPTRSPGPSIVIPGHEVAGLERMIPRRIGGLQVATRSSQLSDLPEEFPLPLKTMAAFLGKKPQEVGVAEGMVPRQIEIIVVRAAGVTPEKLSSAFQQAIFEELEVAPRTIPAKVGGKDIEKVANRAGAVVGYLYVKGDTLFWVTSLREELATEAVRGFP